MQLIRSGALAILAAGVWTVLTPGQVLAQKRQRDLITRAEIESSPKRGDYIYDVIRSLRPHFLEAPRGVRRTSIDGAPPVPGGRPSMSAGGSVKTEVAVFVDQNKAGGIDVLKSIQAEQVEEVRYFDASKAIAEFGLTLGGGGAIVLRMYQGKPPEKSVPPE